MPSTALKLRQSRQNNHHELLLRLHRRRIVAKINKRVIKRLARATRATLNDNTQAQALTKEPEVLGFLLLPGEVRNQIYDLLAAEDAPLVLSSKGRKFSTTHPLGRSNKSICSEILGRLETKALCYIAAVDNLNFRPLMHLLKRSDRVLGGKPVLVHIQLIFTDSVIDMLKLVTWMRYVCSQNMRPTYSAAGKVPLEGILKQLADPLTYNYHLGQAREELMKVCAAVTEQFAPRSVELECDMRFPWGKMRRRR